MIPLSVPNISGNELKYVEKALREGWVSTAGSYVSDFENEIAKYVGTPAAVACQSGTAGLHVALKICGVQQGDLVIAPTLTFIAAVNPVRYLGADPIFMDCDDSLCMDPDKLERFCRDKCVLKDGTLYHKESGRRIPAVVVVHVFGNMADMEKILAVAKKYRLKLVEDATEALGTFYTDGPLKGKFAGTMGDVGVYSFNGNKIITTGGGGMIVSNNLELLKEAKHLTTQAKVDQHNFIHDEVGYNYRLTNLQAALGLAQLEQLEHFIDVKTENFRIYQEDIQKITGLHILPVRKGIRSNHWFYALYCEDTYPLKPPELIEKLKKENIQTRPIWGLIHEQKPYWGDLIYRIEKASIYRKHIVNLPCSSNLNTKDVSCVIKALNIKQ